MKNQKRPDFVHLCIQILKVITLDKKITSDNIDIVIVLSLGQSGITCQRYYIKMFFHQFPFTYICHVMCIKARLTSGTSFLVHSIQMLSSKPGLQLTIISEQSEKSEKCQLQAFSAQGNTSDFVWIDSESQKNSIYCAKESKEKKRKEKQNVFIFEMPESHKRLEHLWSGWVRA